MKLMRICISLLLTGFLMLTGCVSQQQLPYLQGTQYSTSSAVAINNTPPPYQLQVNDVLSVRVQSVQPTLSEMFNVVNSQAMFSGDPGNMFLAGYSISTDGTISLPTIGKVKVQGLTISEAQDLVQQQVNRYVRDANVLVKLLSFKVTILGEVRNPGRYFVYNGQATVLEALGLAGDLTEFGNRRNLKLVRQTPTGSEVTLLDLTDPNLLASPNFYLLPNDAVYVEPMKARTSRGNAGNLGLVFSGISAVVLVLSFIVASQK